jgi:hypothetical protein
VRRVVRTLSSSLGAAVLAAACTTAPVVTHTEYRFRLEAPTGDLRPGQAVPLTWKATPEVVPGEAPRLTARVCVAVAGPYASVEELKAANTQGSPCPISAPRMVVASEVAVADIARGTPIDQPLTLPGSLAPGLYNLLSVFAYESGNQAGAISSAGILRVIAAP